MSEKTRRDETIITLGVGGTAVEIGTAVDKLIHVLEGTLQGGSPGAAPSIDQYLMQLKGARECIERAESRIKQQRAQRAAVADVEGRRDGS